MSDPQALADTQQVHPPGLRTLFFTEMWERFSYYGMRALLVLFMTAAVVEGGLGMDDVTATAIYGLYSAAVYLAALPGGWIAEAIFWSGFEQAGSSLNLVAGLLAGRFDPGAFGDTPGLYLQIVLIAVGAGLLLLLLAGRIGRLTGNKDR